MLGRNDKDKRRVSRLRRLVNNFLTSYSSKFSHSENATESFDLTPKEENCSLLDITCDQLETVQEGNVIKDLVCDLFWKVQLLENFYPHLILVRRRKNRGLLHHRIKFKRQKIRCRALRRRGNRQSGRFTAVEISERIK